MKKNENIFISVQIQKDQELKGLQLSIQFNKNAPNFSLENEAIMWFPTSDEIDLITEVFTLINSGEKPEKGLPEKSHISERPSETITMGSSHRSSEIRIAPLTDDHVIELSTDSEVIPPKIKEEEKIFVQADEKKIDEVLKRKKSAMNEEYTIESGEKTFIDRMLKQKKKKE